MKTKKERNKVVKEIICKLSNKRIKENTQKLKYLGALECIKVNKVHEEVLQKIFCITHRDLLKIEYVAKDNDRALAILTATYRDMCDEYKKL